MRQEINVMQLTIFFGAPHAQVRLLGTSHPCSTFLQACKLAEAVSISAIRKECFIVDCSDSAVWLFGLLSMIDDRNCMFDNPVRSRGNLRDLYRRAATPSSLRI
jgi:hypothetical protein